MKSLIEFIYNGEVNIYQDNLSELLRIANVLKIKGLDEMPSPESTDADEADKITIENPFIKTIKVENLPSTNDYEETTAVAAAPPPPKATKKRKSVSFSDTPEIVCGQQRSTDASSSSSSPHVQSGNDNGNGKRKLRSLSDMCSITKIQKQSESDRIMVGASSVVANTNKADDGDNNDSFGQANKNQQLVVTINPHAIYSSNESINMDANQTMDNDNESPPKKQQQRSSTMSRKMIRKNENFLRALEAVRDEGIGFCKAAKLHGVNNRTLWLEYQKRGYPMKNARKKSQ